ncbi:MAG: hypothetical protein MHPSP_000323 [Paramarteilia canceri]
MDTNSVGKAFYRMQYEEHNTSNGHKTDNINYVRKQNDYCKESGVSIILSKLSQINSNLSKNESYAAINALIDHCSLIFECKFIYHSNTCIKNAHLTSQQNISNLSNIGLDRAIEIYHQYLTEKRNPSLTLVATTDRIRRNAVFTLSQNSEKNRNSSEEELDNFSANPPKRLNLSQPESKSSSSSIKQNRDSSITDKASESSIRSKPRLSERLHGKTFPCPLCGKFFTAMSNIARHIKSIHSIILNDQIRDKILFEREKNMNGVEIPSAVDLNKNVDQNIDNNTESSEASSLVFSSKNEDYIYSEKFYHPGILSGEHDYTPSIKMSARMIATCNFEDKLILESKKMASLTLKDHFMF